VLPIHHQPLDRFARLQSHPTRHCQFLELALPQEPQDKLPVQKRNLIEPLEFERRESVRVDLALAEFRLA
jgi:hypothetical protein